MRLAFASVAALAVSAVAHGQYYTGFEQPQWVGTPAGVPASGVDGWYQPVATGIEHNVHTYVGNTLGFDQNPVGGNQFLGGVSGGGSLFPRAQRNNDFTSSQWTVAYDMAANWSGTGSSAMNLSSFSLQHDTVAAGQFKQFIALNNFVDLANPSAGWKAEFNVFDAAGTATNNLSPRRGVGEPRSQPLVPPVHHLRSRHEPCHRDHAGGPAHRLVDHRQSH
jgi:hypothetical protein